MVKVADKIKPAYYETYGDGLMFQFFGDESQQEVMSALKSATFIKEEFSRISLNQQRKEADKGEIGMRFGIHTGKAKVGIYPNGRKKQAKGLPLNVAKRIEDEVARDAKNTKIALSEQSYELVNDKIEALYLGKFSLKGISFEVGVYEFIDFKEAMS